MLPLVPTNLLKAFDNGIASGYNLTGWYQYLEVVSVTLSEQPLHEQLVQALQKQIRTRMSPHERLPGEREIADQYRVSRNTVRSALSKLEMMGLVYRRRGRGTFVANDTSESTDLAGMYSFTEEMTALGRHPRSEIVYLHEQPATEYLSEHLGVDVGTPMYKMKRVRLADGVPLMVERTFMPADRFPRLSAAEIERTSLYATLRDRYGSPVIDASESFYASLMPDKDAELLGVPLGSPSLNIKRTSISLNREVIEYTLSVGRADQFVYTVRHHPVRTQNN